MDEIAMTEKQVCDGDTHCDSKTNGDDETTADDIAVEITSCSKQCIESDRDDKKMENTDNEFETTKIVTKTECRSDRSDYEDPTTEKSDTETTEALKPECRGEKSSKGETSKRIRSYPKEAEVAKVIDVFQERLVFTFNRKKAKYQRILSELGVNAKSHCGETDHDEEEDVEMIIGEPFSKARCIRNSFRFGGSVNFRSFLRGLRNVIRRRKAIRITRPLDSIPKEDFDCELQAVASELSIAYEYQLAMLADDAEVNAVADHAVRCMMKYLKEAGAVFNPTNLLQAVIEEKPRCTPKYYNKELRTRIVKKDNLGLQVDQRWRLHDVLKQPGVRTIDMESGQYQDFGCFTPFGFSCRPDKYGFRGPLHIWNEKEVKYTLVPNDMTSCESSKRRKITYNPRNIHHSYEPTLCCCHDDMGSCEK